MIGPYVYLVPTDRLVAYLQVIDIDPSAEAEAIAQAIRHELAERRHDEREKRRA